MPNVGSHGVSSPDGANGDSIPFRPLNPLPDLPLRSPLSNKDELDVVIPTARTLDISIPKDACSAADSDS